jgi:uncharacterized membrane protein YphA (DoxX/SURF4 family)
MDTAELSPRALQDAGAPRWSAASRVALRFCFVYFGLFCLGTQILGGLLPIPSVDIPDPSVLFPPLRKIVFWVAAHLFHARLPLVYTNSGSGDKTFDWVLAFCFLVVAAAAAAVWSVVDRKRENYATLYKWFRVFLRFALASELLAYGMAKVIPLQMPFPYLAKLVEPFGNFSPMGVLWASIGASPAYEIFAGCAETLAGMLLIFPRTTMLGALVCAADMTQVFMLNMTYDVPVKLFSLHLLVMAAFLLAPDAQRLVDFFFRERAAAPPRRLALFRSRRANRIALVVQIVYGICLLAGNAYEARMNWHVYGGGSPKSALYGIWDVKKLAVDGVERSPLLTDYERWRRAIFDSPERVTLQRMDDSLARYTAAIDSKNKTMTLAKNGDANWKSEFTFVRPAENQLVLDGKMDGHRVHMEMQLVDRGQFLLVNRGFHWMQEYPLNR